MTDIRVTYSDTVYCTVDDVLKYIRRQAGFDQDSNPSDNQILDMIREWSDEWDRRTRHAWRENTVTEEYHRYATRYRWDAGRPLKLHKLSVRTPLDDAEGDKLEVWDGTSWHDWVADSGRTEGREGDYWVDAAAGQLWIYDRFVWRSRPQVRATYRYGEDHGTSTETLDDGTSYTHIDGPRDIRMAVAKLTASDIITSDWYTQNVPGGEAAPSPERTAEQWRAEILGDGPRSGVIARHKIDPAWVDAY